MKVYTGQFTATASTDSTKTFQMEPGDYPVIAQFYPVGPGGSLEGVYIVSQVPQAESWTGAPVFQVEWNNTTGSDVTVKYYLLVSDSPTAYVAYAGA